ncbi:FecR family protein [Ottowia sp. VDI28]|uniref:FecR family protein n=1 Tax=Ottowia sp. VDI28 TaxID=3133968 RepID=UPI003C303CAB
MDRGQREALELEAAIWAVRCHGGLDERSQARLQAWLDADSRHAAAFDAVRTTLQGVRQMPERETARLRAGLPGPSASRAQPASRPPLWQSLFRPMLPKAVVAAVLFALVGGGWFGWWLQPTFEQSYASERGQQVRTLLPDDAVAGSALHLDTSTRVQVRFFRDRREVKLNDGQVMFAIHPDKKRPFHVLAGDLRITVVGTRFSVRHTASGIGAGHTVVAVEEGRVRVERQAAPATVPTPVVELAAGQMLEGAGDVSGGLGAVTSIVPEAVAQWRNGRLNFNQTPLSEALAEFERYGNTGLVVRDPAVAAMPVGGSFGLRQYQQFAEFLPQMLAVRLVQREGVTEIVAR